LPEVHVIRPPRLVPGARVAVVAPASPVPRVDFDAGAAILGARYQLVHDERLFARRGFLAGDDDARLGELQRALDDPSLAAIFCARGGYGILRILQRLDGTRFQAAPRPIIGFSDVTALHAWAARLGVGAIHGPVVTQLGKVPAEDVAALWPLLESPEPPNPVENLHTLVGGSAEGRLAGGNLEMISRLVGTPWAIDFDDTILLLEEIGERPYRIDRALTQLIAGGALAGVRGAVVGSLTDCGKPEDDPGAAAVVAERLTSLGIPVVTGAPIGHGPRNRPVPIGARARIDAQQSGGARLTFLEGAVS
jgi:muramoyltetrapeptide carboxypeptidase